MPIISTFTRFLAFRQSLAWTATLLAELFPDARNSVRAAKAFADRLVRSGLLNNSIMDVIPARIGDRPLATSFDSQRSDFYRLAYQLELRFSKPSVPTRVYWASQKFAERYGSWAGCQSYPCPQKISHDLLVSQAWLKYLKADPHMASELWVPERRLQSEVRCGDRTGSIPDALIVGGTRPLAVEIGGHYPASWLQHHIERFESAGWAWELW